MNLICGINPVLEALGAGTRHFDRLLVVKGLRNRRISEAVSRAGHLGIPMRFEARETLDRMAAGVPHQGVIAVVSAKPLLGLDALLTEARTPALLLVLDGVEDPRNLGAVLRSAEAAGADGVVLPERHSVGLSETVNRASAGALEHVRVARVGNVAQALETMKARGLWVVGFDANGHERWDAVDYRGPVALVVGGEGRGIRRLVRERCDHLVSLPLFGHVGSLNVSVAAGVALYEVVRQRGAIPSHVRPIPPRGPAAAQVVGPDPEDAEDDPGGEALRAPRVAEAPVDEDESVDWPRQQVVLVDDDENVTWTGPSVGPTMLRDVGRAHRPGDGGRRPKKLRRRRPRPGPGGPPAAAAAAGPAAPAEGAGDGLARRRKRRRGRRPGGDRPGGAGPAAPGAPPVQSGAPEGGGAPNEGAPGGPGRRRRRRRRR
jgi:23S rRNA (guanosine2251-2'-O)-methyltransferase